MLSGFVVVKHAKLCRFFCRELHPKTGRNYKRQTPPPVFPIHPLALPLSNPVVTAQRPRKNRRKKILQKLVNISRVFTSQISTRSKNKRSTKKNTSDGAKILWTFKMERRWSLVFQLCAHNFYYILMPAGVISNANT